MYKGYPGDVEYHAHGFLFSGGTLTPIDPPGAKETFASGINDRGEIVGYYLGTSGPHGYILSSEGFDFIGAAGTWLYDINDKRQIVGYYSTEANREDGLLFSDGTFNFFEYPGASDTRSYGVNNRGEVVGIYFNASEDSGVHGYLGTPVGVPEPSTIMLLIVGLAGLAWITKSNRLLKKS